ncbi:MAG: threonylcarbamoyl-AMP synthase, partial [Sphingomonas bacterium]|nr:threonylcarbamoyl-AMP synthase [Sphingomonas bacterium]
YGLFADATNAAAVAGIYAAKGRPSFNPLIVHVADLAAAERIAVFDDEARDLARRFWPGPLTIILPLRPEAGIAALVTAGLDTIALRVPAHRACQALLLRTGKPLAGPSANRSNAISPTRAAHVAASLDGRIALIIDDGPTAVGLESTIVNKGRVLRPGPLTAQELFPTVSRDARADVVDPARIVAPGQLASHYAPEKPLRIAAAHADHDEWMIGFGPMRCDDNLSAAGDLVEAAANLFEALHRADASPAPRMAVAFIPSRGIGLAINDRLRRAAAPIVRYQEN